jgi:NlpC/P60 family putative phage cell wall peptidase
MTTQPAALITRAHVVSLARSWIGTPYHPQASRLGIGTDCLGLVRGIWRELYGADPEPIPGYQPDWAETARDDSLLHAARRRMVELDAAQMRPGDVLLFRFRPRFIAKHAAVVASNRTMIHALEGATVSEVPLQGWWRRRIAGVFSFPGIVD